MFLIDEDLANAVIEYLSHRPYREVYELIPPMRNLMLMDARLIEYPPAEDFIPPTHQEPPEPV